MWAETSKYQYVVSMQVVRRFASQGWKICTEVLPDISQAPV